MNYNFDGNDIEELSLLGVDKCPECKIYCLRSLSINKVTKEKYIHCFNCNLALLIPDELFNELLLFSKSVPQDAELINEVYKEAYEWYVFNIADEISTSADLTKVEKKSKQKLFNILSYKYKDIDAKYIEHNVVIAFECFTETWNKTYPAGNEEQTKSKSKNELKDNKNKKSKSRKNNNSKKLQQLFKLAREAYKNRDVDNCLKYYLEIRSINPDDLESAFYILLLDTFNNLDNHEKRHTFAVAAVNIALELFKSNKDDKTKAENLMQMEHELLFAQLLYTQYGLKIAQESNRMEPYDEAMDDACYLAYMWVPIMAGSPFDKNIKYDNIRTINECVVDHCKFLIKNYQYSQKYIEYYKIKNMILGINPNFDFSAIEKSDASTQSGNSSGGCYVATCVYGSYDCPEVWTLRRFRDFKLSNTWYGRLFIKCYYLISPSLVKLFGKTRWFRKIWKPKLDKLVKELQTRGYKSTPYSDRKW